MSVAPVQSTQNVKELHNHGLLTYGGTLAGVAKSAQGMGGALAWPALLRKLDKQDSGYKL
ncbi:hypothetical protein PS691_00478 [Pseudomonas fluorescens]|uniref:Uncharacterized protein n=1 Tax=Pseudomonas fluorescens TaxID=294 RepID=A0A5E6ZZJ8_PSEFL|nr:hypothetical protein PS691_00478 [Pseudomonas fluorescens]